MNLVLWRKSLKRVIKKLISQLPTSIRFPLIRRLLRFHSHYASDIEVSLIETEVELAEALNLVRRVYTEAGLMKADQPRIVNPYLSIQGTEVLVAKYKGRVVGTMTLVCGQSQGLPLERVFTIPEHLKRAGPYLEISQLAIDPEYRRERATNCLFLLMTLLYRYATQCLEVKTFFATCLPRDSDFYRAILTFEPIGENYYTSDYLGKPAHCLYLDLTIAHQRFRQLYGPNPNDRNIFYFITEMQHRGLRFNTSSPKPYELVRDAACHGDLLRQP